MRNFTKSMYYRLFLLAFGLELIVDILFAVRPDHEQHPVMHLLGVAMCIVVLVAAAIGTLLLIYNPQLNRHPDPPMSLDLNSKDSLDIDEDVDRGNAAGWPEWRPIAACMGALAAGFAVFTYLIS